MKKKTKRLIIRLVAVLVILTMIFSGFIVIFYS